MELWKSGKIGKLLIKNRIVMSAIAIRGEPDGRLSQRIIDYYVARGKGGTGLIITSSMRVTRDLEQPLGLSLIVDDRTHIMWLSELAEAVHDYGAKIAVHFAVGHGRVAPPEVLRAGCAVSPSPVPCFYDPSVVARELATEEVERLVQRVGFAAQIASEAGIDAIEISSHAGHLLDQFTTPLWNTRTDKYGGDLEGRLRFSVEIIEAVKRAAGADFPVIIKFGLTHYMPGAREIEEGLEMARRWEAAGVDALFVDAGCTEVKYWLEPPTTQPVGCLVDLAKMVKDVVRIPVIAVGKLGVPELAEKVLREGKADFVALGRPLLADPEWAIKVKEGRPEDIRPCIGDHEGCYKRLREIKYVSCTVNPATGMEREFAITPAEKKKSVLVVGGGPGGMEAARVAALKGHRVALWEKSNDLGGNLIAAAVPDFKQDYRRLISYFSTQIKKAGVDVTLGKEATPELIRKMKPEVVVIATGGTPIVPEISGVDKNKVITAVDLLLGKREAGESVVVIGGGLVGCETALYLGQKGKKVIIVEVLDTVVGDEFSANRGHLLKLLADSSVKILTNTKALEITDEGIAIADKNGERSTLKADTIILAVGLKPNDGLLEALQDRVPEVYAIGDCVQPRKVINAIWEGFRITRLI